MATGDKIVNVDGLKAVHDRDERAIAVKYRTADTDFDYGELKVGGINKDNAYTSGTNQRRVETYWPVIDDEITIQMSGGLTGYLRLYDSNKTMIDPDASLPGANTTNHYVLIGKNESLTLRMKDYNVNAAYFRFTMSSGTEEIAEALIPENARFIMPKNVATQEDVDELQNKNMPNIWGLFRNAVCIGDSLTRGYLSAYASKERNRDYGYPSALARLTGMNVWNYGLSGSDPGEWVADATMAAQDYSKFDVAFVSFGQNIDKSGGGSYTESEYEELYMSVLQRLKTANSNMVIFCLSNPGPRAVNGWIQDFVATATNQSGTYAYQYVYYLDVSTDAPYTSHRTDGTHLDALGYSMLAECVKIAVEKLYAQNPTAVYIPKTVDNIITKPVNPPCLLEDKVEDIEDSVGTLESDVSDLKSKVNDLGDVLVDEVSSTTTLSPIETETKKLLYVSNSGNITDGSLDNQKVYAYNIEGYDGLHFNFYGRLNSEANYAFYSASELNGCDSTTVIGSVTAYVSGGDDNYINTIPSGAKIIVIGARQDGVMRGITNSIVSKADTALADSYSTTTVYSIGDYCTYDGKFYRRTTYTGTYGAWDVTAWEQTKPSTEIETLNKRFADKLYFDSSLFQIGYVNSVGEISTSQKYKIVTTDIIHITETTKLVIEDLFGVGIYYYDAQGAYLNNSGWVESDHYLTILPDSYVRIVIQKDGSTATLSVNDIPIYSHAVTFASDYAKEQETIKNNAVGAIRALEAEMYQKGASPVLFPNAPCILVAGQSNIDGRVPKANLPASIVPPFDNIKNSINSVNGTFASSMTLPNSFGIDFSLYAALNDLGTPWYIIKRSMGGTSISPFGDSSYHWTPFYEELDDISKSLLYTFNTQIAKCAEVNPNTYNIRALIWQQGEGDRASTSKKAALEYYKNFKCLIAYIRGISGNEKLPVVCGTVSHLSGQYDPIVEDATLKVAEEDPYVICIDMSGAGLLDAYHFNADAAVYFGYKAYDALIDFGVVSGTKINPVCPWESE